jgi:hypothetical protein
MASPAYYCIREKNTKILGKYYKTKEEYDVKSDGLDTDVYEFRICNSEHSAMNWCARKAYRDILGGSDGGSYYNRHYSNSTSPSSGVSPVSMSSNKSWKSRQKDYKKKSHHGRAEVAYEKSPNVIRKVKEEKHYAVAFGNKHGVFDLEGFEEAIKSCSYARHQEKNSVTAAMAWHDDERKKFLAKLLEDEFTMKCPRAEGESDDDWLDRAVIFFEKEGIEFLLKKRPKNKIHTVPVAKPKQLPIPDDMLNKPVEGEKVTTRHLCEDDNGMYVAILSNINIGFATKNKWNTIKHPTFDIAFSIYEAALNS